MDGAFDYTLTFSLEQCDIRELQYILQVSYGATSLSFDDILKLAQEALIRMEYVEYDISLPEHLRLFQFVRSVFNVLKKIIEHPDAAQEFPHLIRIIHATYTKYTRRPEISPVASPCEPLIKLPKIMKKVLRKN